MRASTGRGWSGAWRGSRSRCGAAAPPRLPSRPQAAGGGTVRRTRPPGARAEAVEPDCRGGPSDASRGAPGLQDVVDRRASAQPGAPALLGDPQVTGGSSSARGRGRGGTPQPVRNAAGPECSRSGTQPSRNAAGPKRSHPEQGRRRARQSPADVRPAATPPPRPPPRPPAAPPRRDPSPRAPPPVKGAGGSGPGGSRSPGSRRGRRAGRSGRRSGRAGSPGPRGAVRRARR